MTVQSRDEPTDNPDMDLEQGMLEQDTGFDPDDDYEDRRLPNGRFPPGQSGNRQGRPRKVRRKKAKQEPAKSLMEAIVYALAEERVVHVGGVKMTMPIFEIAAQKLIQDLMGTPEQRARAFRELRHLRMPDAVQMMLERREEEECNDNSPWTEELEEQYRIIEGRYGVIDDRNCPNCGKGFPSEASLVIEADQSPDDTR